MSLISGPEIHLAQTRHALGVTQVELAAKSGVEQGTISKIETGRMNPSTDLLGKLAAGLGVHIIDLFASRDALELQLLDEFRGKDEDLKLMILRMVRSINQTVE